jgi:decaprenylphospho-beta-D-erythro-pentofuranosid-2-ulose 2-reductase
MSRNVLILGATSAIAEHAARAFAAAGDTLALAARDTARLGAIAEDLRVRGAPAVHILPKMDALDPRTLGPCVAAAWEILGEVHIALVAHGHLPEQEDCEHDAEAAAREIEINFGSVVRLCTDLANRFQAQGEGVLGVISSVAGLRGRQSNYIYGAAKGGLNIFLQGLRNRLASHEVKVITILPGFVDTPMTADLPKGPLFASAEAVGQRIQRALAAGKPDVLYTPLFWWPIMLIIRLIPEPIFKRLKL